MASMRIKISVTVSREVALRLDEESERTGLNKSALVDQVLRRYFKLGYVPIS